MSSQPPVSLDSLIDNAADAMEIELSNTPDTPAPEAAPASPPPTPTAAPEPPAPPVQVQTPPTPTVAQPDQGTPAAAPSDYETLKAEIAALKATLQAPPTAPVVPETPAEPPPTPQELVELDTIISGLSQSFNQVEAKIAQESANRAQWANHLHMLHARLVDSFDDPAVDAAAIRRDIKQAEQNLGKFDAFLTTMAQDRVAIVQNFRVQQTLRDSTERILKLTAAQERASQAENERQMSSEATNWRTAKWEPAKKAAEAKIPEALRGRFDAYVERLGKAHVHSRGEDGRFSNSISDPTAFVNGLVEDFLAVAREGAQSYVAAKTAEIPASPANGKAGTPAPPSANGRRPQTQAEFDAEIDQQWDSVSL
jgi:hypothetical protein